MPEAEERPAPGLYLVGTPIGNLEDITLRALRVLRSVDRIACEDTRQTQKLLNHFGIATPTISCHEHNENERIPELVSALKQGARIAVVSDAGMPGISDPGMRLVTAAIRGGIAVCPVPGANAAISALVASGLNTKRSFFAGFLPAKPGARRAELERLAAAVPDETTLIFYEAPHRILETLSDVEIVWGPACRIVIARELTKLHEEFLRGTVSGVAAALKQRDRVRGEITLLVEARLKSEETRAVGISERLAELQQSENLDEKDALKRIARERGLSKSDVYRQLQRERGKR
ncbi:MAG TPA: 16S rRNA (cytidine(1402)-2'-O)-methyltransferase [Pseudacidobacterium sp.]|nr:16S rRNA (cytidine(1402)-2'-O)-methyltransferase [Pseudacidobacterium sp.]